MDLLSFTFELRDVITYMSKTLINEFPSEKLTIEHLIMSILDNKQSHAYIILSTMLTTDTLVTLKDFYADTLKSKSLNNIITDIDKIEYDEKLNDLIKNSKAEAEALKNTLIGSEHIILAILNPKYKTPIQNTFSAVGINYDFMYNASVKKINEKKINKTDNKILSLDGPKSLQQVMLMPGIIGQLSQNTNQQQQKPSSLSEFTVNINELVQKNKCDFVVGRDNEIKQIIKTMARRKKNNAILLGDSGVGKTSMVYKLAYLINSKQVPDIIQDKTIIMLDVMALVSGTTFRGMFEQRVKSLFDELTSSNKYILFIDDMQQILKTGGKDKDTDMSGMIGDILNNGEVRVIGTIGFKDYKNGIENNANLSRKFQKIIIDPNTQEETFNILLSSKSYYEKYHNVTYSEEVLKYIIKLGEKYISERKLPDSAIDIMDVAGASTCFIDKNPKEIITLKKQITQIDNQIENELYKFFNESNHTNNNLEEVDKLNIEKDKVKIILNDAYKNNKTKVVTEITKDIIAATVSEMTHIPISKLSTNEKVKLINLDKILKDSIIGQDDAIDTICKSIKRNRVGLSDKHKPITVSLLCGPSGVGKTLLAKKIAQEIFDDEKNMIRIDMSEFSEKGSVSKLVGTSPGYVGFDSENMLTDKVRNHPYSVVLLDEIEKASEEIFNILLQVFDDGRLTDGKGTTVSFKNCIILMTSNIGAKNVSNFSKGMGFVEDENSNKKSIFEKALKNKFNPEFINRIDSILYFNSLTEDNLKNIINLELTYLNKRLNENNCNISYDTNVINFILSEINKDGKDYGARPIKRFITNCIEDEIVDRLLEDETKKSFTISIDKDKIMIN